MTVGGARKRLEIDDTITRPEERPADRETISEQQLRNLVAQAVPASVWLTPLKGFKINLSANPGFLKVFFSARCHCETVALLSVEVARGKTLYEVKRALPSLVSKLESQAESFYGMSCDIHRVMRLGPATPGQIAGR